MNGMAGLEPPPFGVKHGVVAGLGYVVLLYIFNPGVTPDWSAGIPMLYWQFFTADVKLLAVALIVSFPITMVLTQLYWRFRSKRTITTEDVNNE